MSSFEIPGRRVTLKVPGKGAMWLHLVVTGTLILAALACWLVFGFGLYSEAFVVPPPEEGHRWGWNALLALACLGWLAILTTYMSMHGIARVRSGAANWASWLAWGKRAVLGATVLFLGLVACARLSSPGGPWPWNRYDFLYAGVILVAWLMRRGRS
ncbi:MAG TPA: hypothetical protein VK753_07655 [Xanthomonadaceae bacterium]|nr:hypothetical protein [Xanthomonadaceae bacterium]